MSAIAVASTSSTTGDSQARFQRRVRAGAVALTLGEPPSPSFRCLSRGSQLLPNKRSCLPWGSHARGWCIELEAANHEPNGITSRL